MKIFFAAATLCCVSFSGFLATSPAWADADPPRYDSDGLCFRQANMPDGLSPETLAHCLANQSMALDVIRHEWNQVPSFAQEDCDQRIRASGNPDYHTLQNCLQMQMRENEPPPLVPTNRD
ncbi:hypothetical protein [Gluconacetobacter asukensis]|uniref:Secreted protein n=1 Tax=Gluconacetobacter asukensis TaxID=1017181 RepID=A0A7W4P3C9_9PROT|nr:hypothetical protein [Gluconacetobacter asukensis]MBB2172635.1 hypothetical protein [Gluconacetobacter asukensis]